MSYIWYVGYGSNLHEQRFLCYINGGTPRFGKKCTNGCSDKSHPMQDKPIIINYSLYFALPDNRRKTDNWGDGGVAFIDPQKDEKSKTFCRMWKITKRQYDQVKNQEGPWYGKQISLGEDSGIPIYTITNNVTLSNIICPSDAYIKTIALGLKESYGLSDQDITDYLIKKKGIRDSLQAHAILKIIASLCK